MRDVIAKFREYMISKYPDNFGPEFSNLSAPYDWQNTYDDLYRALAVLMSPERQLLGLTIIPTNNQVKIILHDSSEYYKKLLESKEGSEEFDKLYEFMSNTWSEE